MNYRTGECQYDGRAGICLKKNESCKPEHICGFFEKSCFICNKISIAEEKLMLVQRETWQPICRLCEKCGSKITRNGRPTSQPTLTGKCPFSPDGRHRPTWVRVS